MNSIDLSFAQMQLGHFFDAAIERYADSGIVTFHYRITATELKAATSRQRLHESVVSDYEKFFASMGVKASYNASIGGFDILVDLHRAVFSGAQADSFSAASAHFRANYL